MLHLKLRPPNSTEWDTRRVEGSGVLERFLLDLADHRASGWEVKLVDIDVPIWKDIDWMSLLIGVFVGGLVGIAVMGLVTGTLLP